MPDEGNGDDVHKLTWSMSDPRDESISRPAPVVVLAEDSDIDHGPAHLGRGHGAELLPDAVKDFIGNSSRKDE